jgi:hypothetical protein
MTGLLELGRRVAAGGQNDDLSRVGGGRLGGGVDPFLQVLDAVDDAAASFE